MDGFSGDGGASTAAQISNPFGVAVDSNGNVYVADRGNNRIRKINSSGIITTIAGTEYSGYSGDFGVASSAQLSTPYGVTIDGNGNIYIADGNYCIRKVNSSGLITTIAGTGINGYSGDGGAATAAQLRPISLAFDSIGNMYIADFNNQRIRKIGTTTSTTSNQTPTFSYGTARNISLCANFGAYPINNVLKVRDLDTGQTLTWSAVLSPMHGVISVADTLATTGGYITPSGLTYTPTIGYSGTDTFSVRISDGTASSIISIRVQVNPLPSIPVVSGSNYVCHGATTTLTASPTGGTWYHSDGNATVSSTGVVSGIGGGRTIIRYSSPANSFGCKSLAIDTMTVIGIPSAGSLSGTSTVCPSASITLTPSIAGGSWSSSNAAVASVNMTGSVMGVSTGIATITYTVTNSCASSTTGRIITVTGATLPTAIGGSPSLHVAGTTTMSNLLGGGVWSSTNPSIATISSIGLVSGVALGADTIIYSFTNSCGITSSVFKRISVIAGSGRMANNSSDTIEATGSLNLNIYPNPTTGIITVSISEYTGSFTASIVDLKGSIKRTQTNEKDNKIHIDMSNLSKGMYLVNVITDDKQYTGRVIVE